MAVRMVLLSLPCDPSFAIFMCAAQIDRTQIAHRDFVIIGIQRDLGAKIGAMHYADVLLRRTDIAWILESDPRMSGFKQHRRASCAIAAVAGDFLEQARVHRVRPFPRSAR